MSWFLLLSLLSGTLELGTLYLAYISGASAWQLFVLPMCYQLGNLLSVLGTVTCRRARALGTGAVGAAVTILLFPGKVPFIAAVSLSSLCIQAARSNRKADCPTWLKRTFRIGGFLLAPIMARLPGAVLTLCLLLPAAALWTCPPEQQARAARSPMVPVMVLHQMHYFVYTYIMPAWVCAKTGSLALSAAAFALTWIVYLIPQVTAERMGGILPRRTFFICHTFLAVAMGVMCLGAAADSIAPLCTAWILTGLGGGSVFCIKDLTASCRETDLTLSENVGHVLGTACAIPVSVAAQNASVAALTGSSCLLVCLTLLSAANLCRKEAA